MTDREQGAFRAAAATGELFSKIAGLAVAITAFAYLWGLQWERAYLGALDGQWLMPLLSPTHLAEEGAAFVGAVLLITAVSLHGILLRMSTAKSLSRWALLWSIVATIAFSIAGHRLSHPYAAAFPAIIEFSYALYVGLSVGELIAHLSEHDLTWEAHHVQLLGWIFMVGLMVGPAVVGYLQGTIDAHPKVSSLACAKLKSDASGCQWRLLFTTESQIALVDLKDDDNRSSRLVPVSDVEEVVPVKEDAPPKRLVIFQLSTDMNSGRRP